MLLFHLLPLQVIAALPTFSAAAHPLTKSHIQIAVATTNPKPPPHRSPKSLALPPHRSPNSLAPQPPPPQRSTLHSKAKANPTVMPWHHKPTNKVAPPRREAEIRDSQESHRSEDKPPSLPLSTTRATKCGLRRRDGRKRPRTRNGGKAEKPTIQPQIRQNPPPPPPPPPPKHMKMPKATKADNHGRTGAREEMDEGRKEMEKKEEGLGGGALPRQYQEIFISNLCQ